jgi:general stress protein YciG
VLGRAGRSEDSQLHANQSHHHEALRQFGAKLCQPPNVSLILKAFTRATESRIMRFSLAIFNMRVENMARKDEQSSGSDKEAAGQKEVTQEQVGSGKKNDPNNFANKPERAAAAGRKGSHQSHKRD